MERSSAVSDHAAPNISCSKGGYNVCPAKTLQRWATTVSVASCLVCSRFISSNKRWRCDANDACGVERDSDEKDKEEVALEPADGPPRAGDERGIEEVLMGPADGPTRAGDERDREEVAMGPVDGPTRAGDERDREEVALDPPPAPRTGEDCTGKNLFPLFSK